MATSSKKKKVVGKDDLKRLMKEKINATKTTTSKRIDSPLAKYNSLGHLSCVLCNTPVKSEMLWTSHIQGRTHKDNIARLKEEKTQKEHCFVRPPSPTSGKKRKYNDAEVIAKSKQIKGDLISQSLPSDFFDSGQKAEAPKPKSILKNSTTYKQQQSKSVISGIGGYDSTGSDDGQDGDGDSKAGSQAPPAPVHAGNNQTQESGLPADFFDAGVAPSTSSEADISASEIPAAISEKLPEGFFDDPKMDAKVRKVEYVDKMDEEWALFQKAMKEETTVSEAILAEDDEEANEERNLAEVEEQLQKWSKVEELARRKEQLVTQSKKSGEDGIEEEGDSDEDLEDLLDWRSKKAWK